jgi:hypothetical protein
MRGWQDVVRDLRGTLDQVSFRLVSLLFLSYTHKEVISGIYLTVEAADSFDFYF